MSFRRPLAIAVLSAGLATSAVPASASASSAAEARTQPSLTGAAASGPAALSSPSDRRARQRAVVRAGRAGTVVFRSNRGRLVVARVKPAGKWQVVDASRFGRGAVDVTLRKGRRIVEVSGSVTQGTIETDVARRQRPDMRALGDEPITIPAGSAGSVTLQVVDGELTIVEVVTNPGFIVTRQRARGTEAEISLRSRTQFVDLEVDVDGGELVSDLEVAYREDSIPATDGDVTLDLLAAGSAVLTIEDEELSLTSLDLNEGWRVEESEEDDEEIALDLTDGSTEVSVEVAVDDGWLEIEIEIEGRSEDVDDDSDHDDESGDDEDDDESDDDEDDEDEDDDEDDED